MFSFKHICYVDISESENLVKRYGYFRMVEDIVNIIEFKPILERKWFHFGLWQWHIQGLEFCCLRLSDLKIRLKNRSRLNCVSVRKNPFITISNEKQRTKCETLFSNLGAPELIISSFHLHIHNH